MEGYILRLMKYFATLVCMVMINSGCTSELTPYHSEPNADLAKNPWEYLRYVSDIRKQLYENLPYPNNIQPLCLNNYLGNIQNIHPKVLFIDDLGFPHRYYMAYTPYPKGATNAENPCIAISDNGVVWKSPDIDVNPLSEAPANGYNSDTHLVWNDEEHVLECWWREYDKTIKSDRLLRRITSDGIVWENPEVVLEYGYNPTMTLSPCIEKVGDMYVMIYTNGNNVFFQQSCESEEGFQWSSPRKLKINQSGLHIWHMDMVLDKETLEGEVVACCFGDGGNNNSADLYYFKINLKDETSTKPMMILGRSPVSGAIDERSIYRSSILKIDGRYLIYYSYIDCNWNRGISLVYGDNPFDLHPYPLP